MSDTWSGTVDANMESGQKTGFTVRKGDVITIVASGWAERGPGKAFGPQGDQNYMPSGLICPDALVGALLMKIGDEYLTPVNTGVFRWTVPVDGEITFLFNDAPGEYDNNSGSFSVGVEKEAATAQPTADSLKYGDRVHLLNGYNDWNGGYLDTYDYSKESGAKHGVITSGSPTRDGTSGTWVIESVTGKANGSEVLSGDTIRLLNAYGNNGGYLDTNGHAAAPELYNVSTADTANRGAQKTLDWVVLFGTAGSPIKIEDPINLRNEYNTSQGGFLDTCNVFNGQTTKAFKQGDNTKYAVYTHSTPNRAGVGTGSWKFMRSKV